MKTCTLCKTEKPLTEFGRLKRTYDGLNFWCKSCLKVKRAEYYVKHKDAYRDVKAASDKRRIDKNPQANRDRVKARAVANPDKVKARSKEYLAKNREKNRQRCAARYLRRREEHLAKCAEWAENNYDKLRAYQVSYYKKRRKEDPLYASAVVCRSRVGHAFRRNGFRKGSSTHELLGCDFSTLKKHIESLFQEGMAWENRGFSGWHIDHVTPLASATDEDSLRKLCHYKNLQPLWASDNFKKGAKIPIATEASNHGRLDNL